MRSIRIFATPALLVLVFAFSASAQEQRSRRPSGSASPAMSEPSLLAASPAYAELLLRHTEYESEVESLLLTYTDDYPRVRELKFALSVIRREAERLAPAKPIDPARLTIALGKLIVRKVELETDLWRLQQTYPAASPEVRRAAKRVEIYERAIKQILG